MNRPLLIGALLTLPLLVLACNPKKEEAGASAAQQTGSPVAKPDTPVKPADTLKETLIAAARQQPATSQSKPCLFMPFGNRGTDAITLYVYNKNPFYAEAVEAGYFTTQTGPPFRLKTTPKYDELMSHSTNADSHTPKLCVGTSYLQTLNSVRQLSPDKYSASGVLKLTPEPWATPEMLKLFGGGSQGPLGREISLIFRRVDGTWQAER